MPRIKRLAGILAVSIGIMGAAAGILALGCAGGSPVNNPATGNDPAVSNAATAAPAQPAVPADSPTPGVFDNRVIFGQSAAFTGPARQLGIGMRLGIEAAFHEVNANGGLFGRRLLLESMDDAYETDFSLDNTRRLIEQEQVFALVGAVGTPTSQVAHPLAQAAGVPFVAPFTGAEFLRDPSLDVVLNVRASYYQETEEMVARLTEDLGITRIAVLYQDDAYGKTGLRGAEQALQRRELELVASGSYPRNTIAVKSATLNIAAAEPDAVIMIGAYAPVARSIELLRRDIDAIYLTVSFVGSNALAEEMGEDGEGIYVTQVVPLPDDADIPLVAHYHEALAEYDDSAEPGFVSLEGYLAGRVAIEGMQRCGKDLNRECFLSVLTDGAPIDFDGIELQYGPGDNQGSNTVFLTVIDVDGQYRQVEKIEDTR